MTYVFRLTFKMPSAGSLGALKSRRCWSPSEKLEALKSPRFLVGAARPKISEILGSAALASGAVFHVFYLSLASARLLGRAHRPGTENQNLLEFMGWPYLST